MSQAIEDTSECDTMNVITILSLIFSTKFVLGANIILIIADDLDLVLDGMIPLENTRNLIGNKGMNFQNCFVASPICCPNRASILTGKYQHNHHVVNNSISGGCYSQQWRTTFEPNTFASQLKNKMGYTTFYAGKYMNQYGVNKDFSVPSGWDWWAALVGNSKYYNYSLSINGSQFAFKDRDIDYLTDSISRMAANFIKTHRSDENPFLMVLAPPAPHAPFTPATRHNDRYKGKKAKRTGNFNTPMQKDKHWLIRMGPSPLPESIIPRLDEVYRRRFETLLAVDELVLNVHKSLTNANLLNNTYIIFTSDNGYHIGQFSMSIDKRQPYETDIRVPLMIRGPGIPPETVIAPVSSVDIYGTILMMAGIEAPSDGTSLIGTLPLDRTLLIEYRGEHSVGLPSSGCPTDADPNLQSCSKFYSCKCQDAANNTYACIRRVSKKYNNMFCVFEDDEAYVEAYDLNSDVDQLNNIGKTMKRGKRYKFRRRLKNMSICQNSGCMR